MSAVLLCHNAYTYQMNSYEPNFVFSSWFMHQQTELIIWQAVYSRIIGLNCLYEAHNKDFTILAGVISIDLLVEVRHHDFPCAWGHVTWSGECSWVTHSAISWMTPLSTECTIAIGFTVSSGWGWCHQQLWHKKIIIDEKLFHKMSDSWFIFKMHLHFITLDSLKRMQL